MVKQMLENPSRLARRVNQTITVLLPIFAASREFPSMRHRKIVGLLNRYFSAMTYIIFAHGGTLINISEMFDGIVWRPHRDS